MSTASTGTLANTVVEATIYVAHSGQSWLFCKSKFGDRHFAIVLSLPPLDATVSDDSSNISTSGPVDKSRSKPADTRY